MVSFSFENNFGVESPTQHTAGRHFPIHGYSVTLTRSCLQGQIRHYCHTCLL